MLRTLCRQYTDLTERDIEQLVRMEETIQYTADLTGADVFIDCFDSGGSTCIVVAQAWPRYGSSVYDRSVVGELAERSNEPAVFSVLETGMPARDIRATTQENKSVRQVAIPICNVDGALIGVLIQEKDISDSVVRAKKLEELSRTAEQQSELLQQFGQSVSPYTHSVSVNETALREIHHRTKNNLQMIASILNIQARRSTNEEVGAALKENVSRILSFAAIHEMLTGSLLEGIPLLEVLQKICHNIHICTGCADRGIALVAAGDEAVLESDRATSVAIVVNELVMNAVEHAFTKDTGGEVQVQIRQGNGLTTVTVKDDGGGFDARESHGLGLQLVESILRDRLRSQLRIQSESTGSMIAFDFTN